MSKLFKFSIANFLILFLVGCGGSGGGGGDDDVTNVFPIPTLPDPAVKIDATNAEAIANSALDFTGIISGFAAKTEGGPSIPQVIKLVTELVTKKNRNLGLKVAGKTEDVSTLFCVAGTAIDTFAEGPNSVDGEIKFSNCDIGLGIILNGSFPYVLSWNDTTMDYNLHYGGTLIFGIGTETITIVLNFTESGNDGTGDFALTPSFSLAGIPGGGYLVTPLQPVMGNFFAAEFTSGEIYVEGDDSNLCITVTPINLATVGFYVGGVCVPLVPPLIIDLT